jgi:hypothetical protein
VITVADTSGIIAASARNARESAACRAVLQEAGTVIISPLVLTEVDHLAKARFGSQARTAIIDFVLTQAGRSRFQIPETGLEVLDTARLPRDAPPHPAQMLPSPPRRPIAQPPGQQTNGLVAGKEIGRQYSPIPADCVTADMACSALGTAGRWERH